MEDATAEDTCCLEPSPLGGSPLETPLGLPPTLEAQPVLRFEREASRQNCEPKGRAASRELPYLRKTPKGRAEQWEESVGPVSSWIQQGLKPTLGLGDFREPADALCLSPLCAGYSGERTGRQGKALGCGDAPRRQDREAEPRVPWWPLQ